MYVLMQQAGRRDLQRSSQHGRGGVARTCLACGLGPLAWWDQRCPAIDGNVQFEWFRSWNIPQHGLHGRRCHGCNWDRCAEQYRGVSKAK